MKPLVKMSLENNYVMVGKWTCFDKDAELSACCTAVVIIFWFSGPFVSNVFEDQGVELIRVERILTLNGSKDYFLHRLSKSKRACRLASCTL